MFKSILLIAVFFIAVSTAQTSTALRRIRGNNAIVGEKNAFGRTKANNLRNSERDLQASMSMALPEDLDPVDIPAEDEPVCGYPILCSIQSSIGYGLLGLDCSSC